MGIEEVFVKGEDGVLRKRKEVTLVDEGGFFRHGGVGRVLIPADAEIVRCGINTVIADGAAHRLLSGGEASDGIHLAYQCANGVVYYVKYRSRSPWDEVPSQQ